MTGPHPQRDARLRMVRSGDRNPARKALRATRAQLRNLLWVPPQVPGFAVEPPGERARAEESGAVLRTRRRLTRERHAATAAPRAAAADTSLR